MSNDTTPPSVTAEDLVNETQHAKECLSRARLLCAAIRNQGRLGQDMESEAFFVETFGLFRSLHRSCQECRNKPSAHAFSRVANIGSLEPIKFNDWTVHTGHDAACSLLQDVILSYDLITLWDERGERRGKVYTEAERLQDCRWLVKWADGVTDEFADDIQSRIDAEYTCALEWLSNGSGEIFQALPDSDREKLFCNGIPVRTDIRDLCIAILANRNKPGGQNRSKTQIAREILKKPAMTWQEADLLIRQTRRFIGS